MRRTLAIIGLGIGLMGFVAGFALVYWRLPPYHQIHRLISGASQPAPHTPPAYPLWRESYRWPGEGVRVVMLGDSITRLGDWRALLGRDDTGNLGIPGDTSYGVLYRAGDGNIPQGSAVFILVGVNDVTRSIPVEDTLANMEKIVRSLAPGRTIYLQSTLFTERAAWNRDIRRIVAGQKQLCARRDCIFVDLNTELAPDGTLLPQYSADGIHLSRAGYVRWADIVRRHLKRWSGPPASHRGP